MKRMELTRKAMEDMGWVSIDKYMDIEDIVHNIKAKDKNGVYLWTYLKCVKSANTITRTEYTMCSTYEHYYKYETLQVSTDNKKWYDVAQRKVEIGKRCIYAD